MLSDRFYEVKRSATANMLERKNKLEERATGPVPERLKLDKTDWKAAVGAALKKKRPKDGWPKEPKK